MVRRYLRSRKAVAAAAAAVFVVWSNPQVVPVGKSSWMPRFGEPGAPGSREHGLDAVPRNLTLHLATHSHSDIGWNLSFEGYYDSSVHGVLRGVCAALWADGRRRFTWGDLAFLDLWLDDEGDEASSVDGRLTWRQVVGELMRRGQWAVVGGTYVSPDEGLTTWWGHNAVVDVGHRTLARQLNATTSVGWQIDNFGHHSTVAHVLGNTGYTALVLGRMAYRDLYDFASQGQLQFWWQSREHTGARPLLTHFLAEHYGLVSARFDFDRTSRCDSDALLGELLRLARRHVRQYPGHGHVLVMMGDDLRFVRAARWFGCLDRLVARSRQHPQWRDVRLQYSTVPEYLAAARPYLERARLRRHGGDFYPYQDKPVEQYWSGILGSRPYLKWLVRDTEQIVQHAEALVAMQGLRRGNASDAASALEPHLEFCRKQVAIGYHHDAITGTCTDAAYADYVRRLRLAAHVALRVGLAALQPDAGPARIEYALDGRVDAYNTATRDVADPGRDRVEIGAGRCAADACAGAAVAVTNAALLAAQSQVVRLRVHSGDAVLVDHAGAAVRDVHVRAADNGAYDVDFVARDVPAFGVRTYAVGNRTRYPDAPPLRTLAAPGSRAPAAAEAELRQGGVRVRLAAERDGAVRIEAGGRVLRHQLRAYFGNPHVQSSGAYVMHSFGLMYSVVFWLFGGALAAGLAAAWAAHSGRAPRAMRALRVPRVGGCGAGAAALVGGGAGAVCVYYAGQVASVARLDAWTRGQGAAALVLPVAAAAYVVGGALRWRAWRVGACVAGACAGVALALLLVPAWQSRPLTARHLRLAVTRADGVCDVARARVAGGIDAEYMLCADAPHLLHVSALVHAPRDREVFARLTGGRGRALRLFDGASVRSRQSSVWTPVPGAFYPAPALAQLDGLAVHLRQSVGVASVVRGALDVLVHRSMSANDFRGLKQPLTDTQPARVALIVDLRADANPIPDNLRVNAPALAFVLPPHMAAPPYAGSDAPALPPLSLVGVRALQESGGLRVDARVLAHGPVDFAAARLLNNAGRAATRVHGDWALCDASAANRTQTPAAQISLRTGEQALFRF
ncbi:Alpha-mannosidase 2 [Coemansia sp. RSA 2706]|nr:Alpha-mannosidase 2 [Coemansia sp. RSA 2706]KAJ2320983.1 mannosyl-oligosaccharide 1,3-1,6-alpha-mannosidase activity protein [Coemansia sp. RSA 2704]KAJ2329707.1 Alpha-mannosidase 2 [Coemansia sp. RSA 2702]KAJ2738903.1 mannosyl-oligosaccharide 1,3-1,6-alpha-mannosidase activity protein [Coemansia sp. Cherry 401B]